jgi:hypothetical protein
MKRRRKKTRRRGEDRKVGEGEMKIKEENMF